MTTRHDVLAHGRMPLLLVGVLLLLARVTTAATINAASCSQANVASAIATAVDGDTVQLPACASTSWSTGVTVSGKAIDIEGAGVDVTTISLSGSITGFSFNGSSAGGFVGTLGHLTVTGAGDPNGHIRVSSTYRFRLHHLKITATANRDILITGSYGLIDHLTVLKSNGSNAIQVLGSQLSPSGRWAQAMDFASPDQVFIEDSSFLSTACNTGLGAIDGFNGSKIHFRHNTVRNQQTYNHGYDTASESALWTLFTNNLFDMAAIPCPIDRMVFIRGGTGLFHNNTMNLNEAFNQYAPRFMVLAYFRSSLSQQGSICGDNSANSLAVDLYTGSPTGYPCFEQTGFGAPWPTPSPWYEFNNVGTGNMGANLQFNTESAHVVLNREFFNDTAKPGFAEYTYPHPFQGGTLSAPPVATITSPTNGTSYSTSTSPLALGGTASDDIAVTSVTWSCDVCGSGTATGTTSWSIPSITLQTGVNIVTVTAHDGDSQIGTDQLVVTKTGGSGNVYYVDQTAGNDANVGSLASPWQNAPGMTAYSGSGSLVAGDTVYFDKADTWLLTGGQGLFLVGGVTYIGDSWGVTGNRAILRANADLDAGVVRFRDHATIPTIFQGFEVDGNNTVSTGIDINHRFFTLMNGATKRVDNVIVHHTFSQQSLGQFKYGIIISNNGGTSGYAENVEILNSVVHDTSRDGICLYPTDTSANNRIRNILVRGNEVYNTGQDPTYSAGSGLLIKGFVVDATLEYNYVHATHGAGVFFNGNETIHYAGVGNTNVHLRYNIIDTPTQPNQGNIRIFDTGVGDPKDLKIYGNLVLSNTVTGGLSNANNSNTLALLVANNTFVGSFVDLTNAGDTPTVDFRNNIIYYPTGLPFTAKTGVPTSHTNNTYYRTSGTLVSIGGTTFTAGTLTTYEPTGLSSDPLFLNVGNPPNGFGGFPSPIPNMNGLSLQPGSPALDTGLALLAAYANSINSASRPQGAGWDRGAYEKEITATPAPSILRVLR